MAGNLSDAIEHYLKQILAEQAQVEIKRAEIADRFAVVPSQINYVIKTRFNLQNGYFVESKRGGGGYIRIEKVDLLSNAEVLRDIIRHIGAEISYRNAAEIIQALFDDDLLSRREAEIALAAISSDTLQVADVKVEAVLRARILVGILHRLRVER
ncbi:MAG TPA: CtsR family transcriptional regulator [Lactobacillaceae bacterium]|jgi:transcriptional regulator CtsR